MADIQIDPLSEGIRSIVCPIRVYRHKGDHRMRNTYLAAKAFLIRELRQPDAADIVESYLAPLDQRKELMINGLFARMLISAQNANMRAGVIGGAIDGIENLGKALFDFDPRQVKQRFAGDPDALLAHIVKTVRPRGQIRTTAQSIWPKYCKTILSAAGFFTQFKDGKDFYAWANHMYADPRSKAALPMVVAAEVEGLGYPLACDFLKDLGYVNYGKPDIHIVQIFAGIGLCHKGASPYQVQKTITQVAEAAGVSAYAVDKVFWLIGSGKFYNHTHLGKAGRVGQKKEQFIAEFNGA